MQQIHFLANCLYWIASIELVFIMDTQKVLSSLATDRAYAVFIQSLFLTWLYSYDLAVESNEVVVYIVYLVK